MAHLIILKLAISVKLLKNKKSTFWDKYSKCNISFFNSHLNGAVLETFSRPALLITDAFNAVKQQARRRERDIQLMSIQLF